MTVRPVPISPLKASLENSEAPGEGPPTPRLSSTVCSGHLGLQQQQQPEACRRGVETVVYTKTSINAAHTKNSVCLEKFNAPDHGIRESRQSQTQGAEESRERAVRDATPSCTRGGAVNNGCHDSDLGAQDVTHCDGAALPHSLRCDSLQRPAAECAAKYSGSVAQSHSEDGVRPRDMPSLSNSQYPHGHYNELHRSDNNGCECCPSWRCDNTLSNEQISPYASTNENLYNQVDYTSPIAHHNANWYPSTEKSGCCLNTTYRSTYSHHHASSQHPTSYAQPSGTLQGIEYQEESCSFPYTPNPYESLHENYSHSNYFHSSFAPHYPHTPYQSNHYYSLPYQPPMEATNREYHHLDMSYQDPATNGPLYLPHAYMQTMTPWSADLGHSPEDSIPSQTPTPALPSNSDQRLQSTQTTNMNQDHNCTQESSYVSSHSPFGHGAAIHYAGPFPGSAYETDRQVCCCHTRGNLYGSRPLTHALPVEKATENAPVSQNSNCHFSLTSNELASHTSAHLPTMDDCSCYARNRYMTGPCQMQSSHPLPPTTPDYAVTHSPSKDTEPAVSRYMSPCPTDIYGPRTWISPQTGVSPSTKTTCHCQDCSIRSPPFCVSSKGVHDFSSVSEMGYPFTGFHSPLSSHNDSPSESTFPYAEGTLTDLDDASGPIFPCCRASCAILKRKLQHVHKRFNEMSRFYEVLCQTQSGSARNELEHGFRHPPTAAYSTPQPMTSKFPTKGHCVSGRILEQQWCTTDADESGHNAGNGYIPQPLSTKLGVASPSMPQLTSRSSPSQVTQHQPYKAVLLSQGDDEAEQNEIDHRKAVSTSNPREYPITNEESLSSCVAPSLYTKFLEEADAVHPYLTYSPVTQKNLVHRMHIDPRDARQRTVHITKINSQISQVRVARALFQYGPVLKLRLMRTTKPYYYGFVEYAEVCSLVLLLQDEKFAEAFHPHLACIHCEPAKDAIKDHAPSDALYTEQGVVRENLFVLNLQVWEQGAEPSEGAAGSSGEESRASGSYLPTSVAASVPENIWAIRARCVQFEKILNVCRASLTTYPSEDTCLAVLIAATRVLQSKECLEACYCNAIPILSAGKLAFQILTTAGSCTMSRLTNISPPTEGKEKASLSDGCNIESERVQHLDRFLLTHILFLCVLSLIGSPAHVMRICMVFLQRLAVCRYEIEQEQIPDCAVSDITATKSCVPPQPNVSRNDNVDAEPSNHLVSANGNKESDQKSLNASRRKGSSHSQRKDNTGVLVLPYVCSFLAKTTTQSDRKLRNVIVAHVLLALRIVILIARHIDADAATELLKFILYHASNDSSEPKCYKGEAVPISSTNERCINTEEGFQQAHDSPPTQVALCLSKDAEIKIIRHSVKSESCDTVSNMSAIEEDSSYLSLLRSFRMGNNIPYQHGSDATCLSSVTEGHVWTQVENAPLNRVVHSNNSNISIALSVSQKMLLRHFTDDCLLSVAGGRIFGVAWPKLVATCAHHIIEVFNPALSPY